MTAPVVRIPTATVIGTLESNIETFHGIPFAKAPTGDLRLRSPVRLTQHIGFLNATIPAAACPQPVPNGDFDPLEEFGLAPLLGDLSLEGDPNFPQSEDCLTVTVTRPKGTTRHDKLPVIFWIYGGAFQIGYSAMYDGSTLVQFGLHIGRPFVFIAVNYRVGGFGFLGGKEVLKQNVANLGLLDQRLGLEWVADNVRYFGGDPDKVTIWGQSAGSIAVMSSGTILPVDPVDSDKAQEIYDEVVEVAGCAGAGDTLQCLREVDLETFTRAVSAPPQLVSYTSIAMSFLPRPGGKTLPDSPEKLAAQGRVAPVPVITGHAEDDATLFALFPANVTTTADLAKYLRTFYYSAATKEQLSEFVLTYGDGEQAIINGSPFRTGLENEVVPGFKRRAALMGDMYFSLTRRLYLEYVNAAKPNISTWSYIASLSEGTPILGSYHVVDIASAFLGAPLTFGYRALHAHLLNFVYYLNPNGGDSTDLLHWPEWKDGHQELQLFSNRTELLLDDFRSESYNWMVENIGLWNL